MRYTTIIMAVNSSLGVTFAIGTTASATNQGEYESDSYTLVGEVEDVSEFGDTFNAVNFTALSDGRVRKYKGTRDAGNVTLTIGMDVADAGQDALTAALENSDSADYNFKVAFTDGDTVPSPDVTPTVVYFSGKVMSRRYGTGGADSIVKVSVDIAINSEIIEVEAA